MTAPKPRISNDRLAEIIEQRAEDRDVGRCMFVVVSRRTDRNDSVLVEDILLDLRDARARLASLPALVEACEYLIGVVGGDRSDYCCRHGFPICDCPGEPSDDDGAVSGPCPDSEPWKRIRAALALARGE